MTHSQLFIGGAWRPGFWPFGRPAGIPATGAASSPSAGMAGAALASGPA